MIVEIVLLPDGADARLLEPDVFTAFKVVLRDAGSPVGDRLATVGVARLDEHAWIRIEALRELAGPAATAEWEQSLAGMLEFARSRGWIDDDLHAIRAHVEREVSR